jgi:hypothetical protein
MIWRQDDLGAVLGSFLRMARESFKDKEVISSSREQAVSRVSNETSRVPNYRPRGLWRWLSPKTRVAAQLLHRGSGISWSLFLYPTFYLQNTAFPEWAMLGSNQRPPPCKLGQRFSGRYCSVGNTAYISDFRCFLHRCFPAPSGCVLLRLQHGCSI